MHSILRHLIIFSLFFGSFSSLAQVVTAAVIARGYDSQNFRSVGALSNGDIVACLDTEMDYVSVLLPPGYGAFSDELGTASVLCFSNEMTEVKWAVTRVGNPYFKIHQLQTDDYGNSYVVFSGAMNDPFILNETTLSDPEGYCTALVKIDSEGNIVWHRIFGGFDIFFKDKLKIENGEIHMLISFSTDISNPMTGATLPLVGDKDSYLTRLSLDNEPIACLHIHSDAGSVDMLNYAVAPNGNYAVAMQSQKNVIINGVTHYETPDIGYQHKIFEVSADGETLLNSIRFYSNELDMTYTAINRLVIAGKGGAVPFNDFPGDTVVVIANPRIFFAELNEDFEPDWLRFFYTTLGATSDLNFNDLKKDCLGNYYLTGSAQNLTKFGELIFYESSFLANNWGDAFIVKTAPDGEPEWLKYGGGELFTDEGVEIAIDHNGTVFVAGYYMTDCFFDDVELDASGGGMQREGMVIRITNTDAPSSYPAITASEVTGDFFGGDGAIDITVENGSPTYSFDWSNDELNDFDDTEDVAGLTAGSYSVVVKDQNGCKRASSFVVENFVNLSENEVVNALTIFPNPFEDYTTLTFDRVLSSTAFLEVRNLMGQIVYTSSQLAGSSHLVLTNDQMGSGMYMVFIYESGKVIQTAKLIVQG